MARDDYCPPAAPLACGRGDIGPGRDCVRPRGIADWLLWYTDRGACRVASAGGQVITGDGEAVLIPPRVPHDYGTAPGARSWGCLWTVFKPRASWLELLAWPEAGPGVRRIALADPAARDAVERHLAAAEHLARGPQRGRADLAMNALEAALLWCREACQPNGRRDLRLQRAVDWLCERLAEPIRFADAAELAGVSKPHFFRLFRRHLGTSPQRFLEERRIERALHLLRATPLAVGEIAERCGFASPFYFSLRFKRLIGKSPSEYRCG